MWYRDERDKNESTEKKKLSRKNHIRHQHTTWQQRKTFISRESLVGVEAKNKSDSFALQNAVAAKSQRFLFAQVLCLTFFSPFFCWHTKAIVNSSFCCHLRLRRGWRITTTVTERVSSFLWRHKTLQPLRQLFNLFLLFIRKDFSASYQKFLSAYCFFIWLAASWKRNHHYDVFRRESNPRLISG